MVSKNVSDGKKYLAKIGRCFFFPLRGCHRKRKEHFTLVKSHQETFLSAQNLLPYPKDYAMSGYLPVMLSPESTICLAIVGIATV
jgi:hypothetical protein